MQSIDIFPWDEHFNTGIPTIDTQHRKLVAILNSLATKVAYGSNKEGLSGVFDELIEYTLYHFQTEEAIWNKYLADDALDEEHKAVHQSFIDTALRLKSEQDVKPLHELADDTLGFLARWLASHILDTDRHMSYIVFALQGGKTLEEAKVEAEVQMSGSSRLLINIILSIYSTLSSNTLQLMRELKSHIFFEEKMRYQERYRRFLFELSVSFINIPLEDLDAVIDAALEKMASFVGADRAYIFAYDLDKQTTSNTYEWCGEDIIPQRESLQDLPLSMISGWYEIHSQGEDIFIEDVVALPNGSLKDILLPQEIQSLLTISLMHGKVCQGFVGFDAVKRKRSFSEEDRELLKLFGILLSNVKQRKEKEKELNTEKSFLKTLIQTLPDLIWFKDPEGVYLACNTRFEEFFGAKEKDIVGKTDYDFVAKNLADFFRTNDMNAMQSQKAVINQEEIPFASDGHTEIVQVTKVPMYDDYGKLMGVLGVSRDITQRTLTAQTLQSERLMLQAILDNAPMGIWMTSPEGKVKFVNKTFCDATGISEEAFLSAEHYANLLPSDATPNCIHSDKQALSLEFGAYSTTQTLPFIDGNDHLLEITKVKVQDAQANIGIIGLAMDITERQKQQHHLEYIAHYDMITGLPNRVLLADRLQQALLQAMRHKSSLAVVYLDLDGFKAVNDVYGHDNGDKLLSVLAKRMKQTLRDGDTIARLGGDEFVAVLPDMKNLQESITMLERLLFACAQEVSIDDIHMQVSASLGVAFFESEDSVDAEQLLRQADQAMYQAKVLGKNRYYIFDVLKDKNIRTHHESLDEIEKAIKEEQFVLYYQPKVNMKSGEIVGVEALVRWIHPEKGLLAPAAFLPLIVGHALSVKLGKWVLENAVKQMDQWKREAIDIHVSVNVDALQLQEKDFISELQNLLNTYPLVENKNLSLEVLETSAINDIVHVTQIMKAAHEIGVYFSLDDFGTGYSSLTYLRRLPAKELKIDQSFVRDMLYDPDDLALLDGVLSLATAFGRDTIAEGVESIEHGVMLLRMGCEIGQGYVIARPMPAESLGLWMQEWKVDERWANVSAVNREDMPLLYALVEHKAWMKNLIAYLNRECASPPILSHLKCHFGLWIQKNGYKNYINNPIFEQIEILHTQLHEEANSIIMKYHEGILFENQNAINTLQSTSDTLNERLLKLIK
ncbi:MAG: bacteriohemerythrin [Sulfurimonas sp.]|nr:bacteriohemerythrin [Sulfurimonas sp.]